MSATSVRVDLYQRVTDQIIAQLEAGAVPWVRPWAKGSRAASAMMPHNAITLRPYSGVNVLLLWGAGEAYASHAWLTFKQAQAAGGHVKKGEHGTMIVFADRVISKGERAKAHDENRDARAYYMLKSFVVFNREQCEGLPAAPDMPPLTIPDQHAAADRLIKESHARILIGGDKAAYYPGSDSIVMPPVQAFADPLDWYRTTLHELTHWTGADNRLKREIVNRFGTPDYAREELVAEMGAAFTCATLGIEPTLQHAPYLASWIKVLREDNRAIVKAASKASKASEFLLAFVAEEAEEPEKLAA